LGPVAIGWIKNKYGRKPKMRVEGEEACVGPIPMVVFGPKGCGKD